MCECAARDACSRQAVVDTASEGRFTKDHPRRVLCITVLTAKRLPATPADGAMAGDRKVHFALFLNNQRVGVSIPAPARSRGQFEEADDDEDDDENDADGNERSGHGVAHWGKGASFKMEIDDDIHRTLGIKLYRTDLASIQREEEKADGERQRLAAADDLGSRQTAEVGTGQGRQSPDHNSSEDSDAQAEAVRQRRLRAQKMLRDNRNVMSMKNVYAARCVSNANVFRVLGLRNQSIRLLF